MHLQHLGSAMRSVGIMNCAQHEDKKLSEEQMQISVYMNLSRVRTGNVCDGVMKVPLVMKVLNISA